MNPTREALKKVLEDAFDDGELDPATGVYHVIAPANTPFPYVVYHKASGRDILSFQDDSQNEIWIVKGVSDSSSGAEDIDVACRALLNRSKFDIEGKVNQGMIRIGDIPYSEREDGETYFYEGGEYRLFSEHS